MLKGIDISSFQGSVSYGAYDFVIIKASEGVNWKDPGLDRHLKGLFGTDDPTPQTDKLYGFYHYARPDLGNSPEEEAKSFLSFIRPQIGHCLMALDWEQKSLDYSPDWALQWLDYVYRETGVRPLLYTQASQAKLDKYARIAQADYGLWVAHWGVSSPTYRNWPSWAVWQYSNSPMDMDYFNGDAAAWRKYCGAGSPEEPEKEEPDLTEAEAKKIARQEIEAYFGEQARKPVADWAEAHVKAVQERGIMNGDEEGGFRPYSPVTRQELAATMVNALGIGKEVSDWAEKAFQAVTQLGLLDGTMPQEMLTREQFAVVLQKLVPLLLERLLPLLQEKLKQA